MYIIAKQALAWQELIKLGNGNWGRCLLGKDRTFKDGILLQPWSFVLVYNSLLSSVSFGLSLVSLLLPPLKGLKFFPTVNCFVGAHSSSTRLTWFVNLSGFWSTSVMAETLLQSRFRSESFQNYVRGEYCRIGRGWHTLYATKEK